MRTGSGTVSSVGNFTLQMYASITSSNGHSFSEKVTQAFNNVNWKDVGTYGVAGAVAGATYGAINPAATIAGVAAAGAMSGVVSGQVAALFDATWDSVDHGISTGQVNLTNDGFTAFFADAHEAGFFDPGQMAFDAVTGAVLAGTTFGITSSLTLPQGGNYVTQSARNANSRLPGASGSFFRGVSKWVEEETQQVLDSFYVDRK